MKSAGSGGAGARGVAEAAIAKVVKGAKFDKATVDALRATAKAANDAMRVLDSFTGGEFADAMALDPKTGVIDWDKNNPVGKAVENALDKQQALSNALLKLINNLPANATADQQAALEEAMLQCDRRLGEIETVILDLTEIAKDGLDHLDEKQQAQLGRRVVDLADEKALQMNDRSQAIASFRKQLAPILAQLDRFDANLGRPPTKAQMTTFRHLVIEAKNAIAAAAKSGVIDPALDDRNVVESRQLGSGGFNTVDLVTFKDGTKRVFKPEFAGRLAAESCPILTGLDNSFDSRQELTRINRAVNWTADALGLGDVMVKTTAGLTKFLMPPAMAKLYMDRVRRLSIAYGTGSKLAVDAVTSDPGFRKLSDGSIEIDVSKAKSPLTVSGLYHSTAFHQVTVPDEMDFDLCQQLKGLKVGPGRDALLKDWADRLGGTRSPQYRNAVVRLDTADRSSPPLGYALRLRALLRSVPLKLAMDPFGAQRKMSPARRHFPRGETQIRCR